MFRYLMPLLADQYHAIAPDSLGFGFSDTPSVDEFDYTFDASADLDRTSLAQLHLKRFAIYVQDYGAPVGWRLALAHPSRLQNHQNGNGYDAGFEQAFWKPVRQYWQQRSPATEAPLSRGDDPRQRLGGSTPMECQIQTL